MESILRVAAKTENSVLVFSAATETVDGLGTMVNPLVSAQSARRFLGADSIVSRFRKRCRCRSAIPFLSFGGVSIVVCCRNFNFRTVGAVTSIDRVAELANQPGTFAFGRPLVHRMLHLDGATRVNRRTGSGTDSSLRDCG